MPIDYTKFSADKAHEAKPDHTEAEVGYWWKETVPADRATQVIKAAGQLKDDSEDRSQANLRHARLYGNFDATGFGSRDYTKSASAPQNKIALNIVAACIDTLEAKIAKNKPRPNFLTDGGSFREAQRAKALDKFTRGLFYEGKIYDEAPQVFLDGCTFDVGALKVFRDPNTGKVAFERTFPEELYVDDSDGRYGKPRQLFQRKLVAKELVVDAYVDDSKDSKELAERIRSAKPPEGAEMKGFGDVVEVWEAWHLPSSKSSGDGCHVIAIEGVELFHEKWTRPYFPFAFFRFARRVLGFWGQGVAERLSGIQLEINRLLRSVSEQLRRKGKGRIFVKMGSKVNPSHLTNGFSDVVFYNGDTPPTVDNGNAVAPEEFMQIDRLYAKAFQEIGVSELSAGGKKPSGLDAAVAMREFNDIETERFIMIGKGYEKLFLDAAEIAIDLIADDPGEYKTKLIGKHRTETLAWKDVSLERDRFVMQMFPVSSLPQTPAYRYQRVKEMLADGFIDKPTADRLLDLPDIEHENNLRTAALDDVDATIAAILEEDKPRMMPVEELQNLEMLLSRATAAYLRVRHTDIEPKRKLMLVALIDQCKTLLIPPEVTDPMTGAPAAPAGAMDPMAAGMPMDPMMAMGGGAPVTVNPTVNMDIDPNFAPPAAPLAPPVMG